MARENYGSAAPASTRLTEDYRQSQAPRTCDGAVRKGNGIQVVCAGDAREGGPGHQQLPRRHYRLRVPAFSE